MSIWIGRLWARLDFSRNYSMKELESCGFKADHEKLFFFGLKLGFFRIGIAVNPYRSIISPCGRFSFSLYLYFGFWNIYICVLDHIRKKDILNEMGR
jgi:hypothetical protein